MGAFTAVLPLTVANPIECPFEDPDFVASIESWLDHAQNMQVLNVEIGDVAVHSQCPAEPDLNDPTLGLNWHFHVDGGPGQTELPWEKSDAVIVMRWLLEVHLALSMVRSLLDGEITTAASWYGQGFTHYPGRHELLQQRGLCDSVEVFAVDPLPLGQWPGTGHGDIRHASDATNDMWLLWNPKHVEPDRLLGRIRTLDSGEVQFETVGGTPWDSVGISEADATEWMRVAYHNHLLIHDAEKELYSAAIRVIAGLG
jgi:hypothetical protein